MDNPPSVFDRDAALEMVEGRLDILLELANVFLDYYPKLLLPLDEAVNRADPEALAHAAHDLKGSVSFFGPTSAATAAAELERVAARSDFDAAARLHVVLRKHVEDLVAALRQLVTDR